MKIASIRWFDYQRYAWCIFPDAHTRVSVYKTILGVLEILGTEDYIISP